jgi:hypothetical protein
MVSREPNKYQYRDMKVDITVRPAGLSDQIAYSGASSVVEASLKLSQVSPTFRPAKEIRVSPASKSISPPVSEIEVSHTSKSSVSGSENDPQSNSAYDSLENQVNITSKYCAEPENQVSSGSNSTSVSEIPDIPLSKSSLTLENRVPLTIKSSSPTPESHMQSAPGSSIVSVAESSGGTVYSVPYFRAMLFHIICVVLYSAS